MKKYTLIFLLSIILFGEDNFFKYDNYFKKYGEKYNISYILLKTIALTENDKLDPDIVRKNKNKSKDIGLMQINTLWIKELPKFHLSEKKLKNIDINIEVSAYILSRLIKKYGYSWNTIGMYHSKTKKYKKKWIQRAKKKVKYIIKKDNHIKLKED